MPDVMRAAPMNMSIVPVMRGGKSLRIIRGGIKAITMARRPVMMHVPRIAPNSSGQGSFVPSAAVLHVPFSY